MVSLRGVMRSLGAVDVLFKFLKNDEGNTYPVLNLPEKAAMIAGVERQLCVVLNGSKVRCYGGTFHAGVSDALPEYDFSKVYRNVNGDN